MILDNGYDYLCVSRSNLKTYNIEAALQQIAASLTKKGGVKQKDKVHQRIGRLTQKYPSIAWHFDIETEVFDQPETKRKKKDTDKTMRKPGL